MAKQCANCKKELNPRDYGNSEEFEKMTLCPDCAHAEEMQAEQDAMAGAAAAEEAERAEAEWQEQCAAEDEAAYYEEGPY